MNDLWLSSLSMVLVLLVGQVNCQTRQRQNPATNPPDVQRVLDRYAEALGGRNGYQRITSRSIKGTFEYNGVQQHATGNLEMYWEAPNKLFEMLQGPFGVVRRGYNGREAWGFHPQRGVRQISPFEVTEIIREGALYQPLKLSDFYTQMSYEGKKRIDGREVEVVAATTINRENRTERFYFDAATDLPVRLDLWEEGPEDDRSGEYYLAQFHLGDYRVVDGIRIPFSIRRVRPNSSMVFTFTEVRQNVDLDDNIFESSQQRRNNQ